MAVVPAAAQIFLGDKVYLHKRVGGVWQVAETLYDNPAAGHRVITFTSGALSVDRAVKRGIVGRKSSAGQNLVFLGNGAPDPVFDIPDQFTQIDYWNSSNGAFWFRDAYWLACYNEDDDRMAVIKSTDDGASWTELNSAGAPTGIDTATLHGIPCVTGFSVRFDEQRQQLLFFGNNSAGGSDSFALFTFDMSSGGEIWSAPFGVLDLTTRPQANMTPGNGIIQYANDDIGILYSARNDDGSFCPYYRLYASGSWGSEVPLLTPTTDCGFANVIIDLDDPDLLWVTYINSAGTGSPFSELVAGAYPVCVKVTHAGTITHVFDFPTTTGGSDGVGHGAIFGTDIFIPYDDFDDTSNAVWVAPISTGVFVKELLPIPPGEKNAIATATPVSWGLGYAVNDTGTIDGGSTPATYKVTSIGSGGSVTGLITTSGGLGYSVATGVGTTPTIGAGSGLRINILTVLGGVITSFSLGAGVGYAPGDTGTILGGTALATYIVSSVDANGSITGLAISSGGTGYSIAGNVGTTTSGAGTGLTMNILSLIDNGLSCAYMIFTTFSPTSSTRIPPEYIRRRAMPGS